MRWPLFLLVRSFAVSSRLYMSFHLRARPNPSVNTDRYRRAFGPVCGQVTFVR